ncbi:hypothetical protein [Brumimicrobium mesophilum]|uniref:hypothetical protein n=1 Tax=Brumimicrobium mesophilum TaxID=392717 RepID=UPI00131C2BBE|nr:hypothetical protein [Brumimicrobium mesophilum]
MLLQSCQKDRIELIPFPPEFYAKCFIDKSQNLVMVLGGDNLYTQQNRILIDSLVLDEVEENDKLTVTLYKEARSLNRTNFGQDYEPFGNEWESYLGVYRYGYFIIHDKQIVEKGLYDNRRLIELNGKEIK